MRKYFCDRCKTEVSNVEHLHEIKIPDKIHSTIYSVNYTVKPIEVCAECNSLITRLEQKYRLAEVKNRFNFYKSLVPEFIDEEIIDEEFLNDQILHDK